MPANWGTWSGFLAMAFAIVGLVGVFATYATALPYQRGLREEAALDQALATGGNARALEALRPAMAGEADDVIDGKGSLAERVKRARTELMERVDREGRSLALRMRFWIAVFTVVMGLLGVGILGMISKG